MLSDLLHHHHHQQLQLQQQQQQQRYISEPTGELFENVHCN